MLETEKYFYINKKENIQLWNYGLWDLKETPVSFRSMMTDGNKNIYQGILCVHMGFFH